MSIPQKERKVNLPTKLLREFYARDTHIVARELLGKRLVRLFRGRRLSGIITEVEAYTGEDDRASHASPGPTARNAPMYGPPGFTYVYLIYGVHHCLNLVTERDGFPAAILIRAIEPQEGLTIIEAHRGPQQPRYNLTRGPGRVCQALSIDRDLNNYDLCGENPPLWLEDAPALAGEHIANSPRIGVRGDRHAVEARWRYFIRGNPWVSGTKAFNSRY